MLENVRTEHEFVLLGGKRIKNIIELGNELKQMPEETFNHHVNDIKNDFANWIEDCTKDRRLALLIRTTKNRERMASIVERRIKELTRPWQQHLHQPNIIKTKNITLLNLSHEKNTEDTNSKKILHRLPYKTMLSIAHKEAESTQCQNIPSAEKNPADKLTEIYVHEVNKHHHSAAVLLSHLALGIVIGVAATALVVMLNILNY